MNNNQIDFKKYIFVFLITGAIFATAIYLSNFFGQKKIEEIKNIQDKIAVDILSSETQFSLLEDSSCKDFGVSAQGALSSELSALEEKLSLTEEQRGQDDKDIVSIKRYYTLLQIKDYLLMKKIAEKCKTAPVFILYFYSNNGDCPDCQKEGFVLTRMREEYPDLRVYAFDYNLDVSALKTLIKINKVEKNFPALIINENIYYGFKGVDDLENMIPQVKKWKSDKEKLESQTSSSTKKN
jgi:hypothetical protein